MLELRMLRHRLMAIANMSGLNMSTLVHVPSTSRGVKVNDSKLSVQKLFLERYWETFWTLSSREGCG